jgi:hypothetical protein
MPYGKTVKQSHDAQRCYDPTERKCNLILVDTPKRSKDYIHTPGKSGLFAILVEENRWTFDGLCTHFARRAKGTQDDWKERRKRVFDVGWVDECLTKDIRLWHFDENGWEVM